MKRKTLAALSLCAVLLLSGSAVLTGCSGGEAADSTESQTAASDTAASSSSASESAFASSSDIYPSMEALLEQDEYTRDALNASLQDIAVHLDQENRMSVSIRPEAEVDTLQVIFQFKDTLSNDDEVRQKDALLKILEENSTEKELKQLLSGLTKKTAKGQADLVITILSFSGSVLESRSV